MGRFPAPGSAPGPRPALFPRTHHLRAGAFVALSVSISYSPLSGARWLFVLARAAPRFADRGGPLFLGEPLQCCFLGSSRGLFPEARRKSRRRPFRKLESR